MKKTIIRTDNLSIGYEHQTIKSGINLSVYAGELVCVLGPNGCGKSTLLRTLCNLQVPRGGALFLKDVPLHQYENRLAREISVVLTERINIGTLSVFEVVALGRYPYTNWMGKLEANDVTLIRKSLEQVGMLGMEDRRLGELSDGEQQRIMLAKALAQDTPIILLDEPTAHLDLPNRVAMMHLLRKLSVEMNKSIVMSTHELDLALQVADCIWLMSKESDIAVGAPEDLVLNGIFGKVFEQDNLYFDRSSGIFKIKHEPRAMVGLQGEGVERYWTQRALERVGIGCSSEVEASGCIIEVLGSNRWKVSGRGSERTCERLGELLEVVQGMLFDH